MKDRRLPALSWGALRLMRDGKLLRDEPPSRDPIVLALVDAGLCCGKAVWLDGEDDKRDRAWEYEFTQAGRETLKRGQAI